MAICYITRREHFNAAHRVYRPEWSDEKNMAVFGKCANKNGHGHNFVLLVTLKGEPDPATGFVCNLKDVGEIVRKHVVEQLDHKNLNLDVPFMQDTIPTIEHLAVAIWRQIEPHVPAGTLHRVKLIETENNYVEYFGD